MGKTCPQCGAQSAGYFSGLVGLLIGYLTTFGFKQLGGKVVDGKGVIACSIIMVLVVYLGVALGYSLIIADALSMSAGEAFGDLKAILSYYDLTGQFIKSLLMGYFFTALGGVSVLIQSYGEYTGKRQPKAKKQKRENK